MIEMMDEVSSPTKFQNLLRAQLWHLILLIEKEYQQSGLKDTKSNPTGWQYNTATEKDLAEKIADMEKYALDRFFNGDMSGYRALWSKKRFTYFDALTPKRVESLDGFNDFLNNLE